MKTRAITGFFFVLVMLASVLTGAYTFSFFYLIIGLLCLIEFYKLVKQENVNPGRISGLLLALAIYLPISLHFLTGTSLVNIVVAVPFVSAVFIAELYFKAPKPFHNIAYTFLGIIFSFIPFCFFQALGFTVGIYNFHFPLSFLLLLWANDTGAYLFGVKFGKNKLFERHSPKKSWEGFFGGMITSLLVAFILGTQFTDIPLVHWAVISLIIVITGTLGDLIESMLKRSLNAKDSGSLLPGHGGVLDRFDGLLLSAPLVFVYLYLVQIW
ncbi:phosphatidate cytidylyltransferase [Rubrolithibacter danxiaensis]|uniref:phosphatidate cytidylyltransferase n=1 Tax=Rubrolithibacter danxiaensis TaxID=3390805 RepID=UPI003BF8276C